MGDEKKALSRWISGVEPPERLLRATGTQILEIECREQPHRLLDLIQAYRNDPTIRAELKKFRELSSRSGPILFLGMGASYCSSFGGSVLLQTHGRPSVSRTPANGCTMRSQSGTTRPCPSCSPPRAKVRN